MIPGVKIPILFPEQISSPEIYSNSSARSKIKAIKNG